MSCLDNSSYFLKEGGNMKEIYTTYFCIKCKKTTILLTDEVDDTVRNGNYLSCSHCGYKRIHIEDKLNDLRQCMNHESYKKVNGKIRQVRR
jgi:DNA-directed RNA polymerase subunit RPC12/RpoP